MSEREPEREGEHRHVHADLGDARHVLAEEGDDEASTPRHGEDEPERAAREREHDRLGEELPDDARAARAERRAHRDLLAAPERPREDEVGDVGAGDQQHEADRAEQHEQRRPHVADEVLVERDDRGAPALVVLRDTAPRAGPRSRSSARVRRASVDAVLQAREHQEVVDAADGAAPPA